MADRQLSDLIAPKNRASDDFDLSGLKDDEGFDLTGLTGIDTRSTVAKWADTLIPMGMRVGGSVMGAVAGAGGGLLSGPGALVTGAGGFVTGGMIGETGAEWYEKLRGLRSDINPLQVATQGALNLVTPAPAATSSIAKFIATRAGQNAGLGAMSSGFTDIAEGQMPTLRGMLTTGAVSAPIGGVAGAWERGWRPNPGIPRVMPDFPSEASSVPVGGAAPRFPPVPSLSVTGRLRSLVPQQSEADAAAAFLGPDRTRPPVVDDGTSALLGRPPVDPGELRYADTLLGQPPGPPPGPPPVVPQRLVPSMLLGQGGEEEAAAARMLMGRGNEPPPRPARGTLGPVDNGAASLLGASADENQLASMLIGRRPPPRPGPPPPDYPGMLLGPEGPRPRTPADIEAASAMLGAEARPPVDDGTSALLGKPGPAPAPRPRPVTPADVEAASILLGKPSDGTDILLGEDIRIDPRTVMRAHMMVADGARLDTLQRNLGLPAGHTSALFDALMERGSLDVSPVGEVQPALPQRIENPQTIEDWKYNEAIRQQELKRTQDLERATRGTNARAEQSAFKARRFDNEAPEVQSELRRILAEMENGEFVDRPFIYNESGILEQVKAGAAGAKVFNDIGGKTRQSVKDAIRNYIEGGKAPTDVAQRALTVAEKRLGIQEGSVSAPLLPPGAGDPFGTPLPPEIPRAPRSLRDTLGGFEDFANVSDEAERAAIQNEPSGPLPDDAWDTSDFGAVNPALLARLAGATGGGLIGAASAGEGATTEERLAAGAAGAAVGYGGAAGLGKIMGRMRPPAGKVAAPDPFGLAQPGQAGIKARGNIIGPTTTRAAGQPIRARMDPLAGTEVMISKFPEHLQGGLKEALIASGGSDAQRRGVLTNADLDTLSEKLTVDATKVLKPGTALPAEGIRRYRDALATTFSEIKGLTEKVKHGGANDRDIVALAEAEARRHVLLTSAMGARTESSRALAEWKTFARVLHGDPSLMMTVADTLRGKQREFANAFADVKGGPLEQLAWLQKQKAGTWGDKARSYFYSSILSNVKTHERNFLGNLSNLGANMVLHPVAAAVDAVTSVGGTRRPREVYFSEMPSQVAGAVAGLDKGVREAIFTLRHGISKAGLEGSISEAQAGKLDLPRVELGGGGKNPLNYPMRALDAADQFFRAVNRESELYGSAHAQARKEGLSGKRLEDRVAGLVTGTDETAQALQGRADAFARRAVFQEKPGQLTQALQHVQRYPGAVMIMPFVKTPGNIVRQGLEFSPLGFMMKEARKGGRVGSQGQARALAGTFAMGGLAYLAATGRLTGSGPSNIADRAQLMESGWRPNSLRITNPATGKDSYVSYTTFQPLAVPASIVANGVEAWQEAGANPDKADSVAMSVLKQSAFTVGKSARSLLDQSFISGVSDFFDMVNNYDSASAEKALGRQLQSLTPFSGLQRSVKDALDPNVRAPETIGENVMANTPGLSRDVPVKQDRFGRPLSRSDSAAQRVLDPFNTSPVSEDPVVNELGRLGVSMGYPSGTIGQHKDLPRDVQDRVTKLKGTATYKMLEKVIAAPAYQRLQPKVQRLALDRVIDLTRNTLGRELSDAMGP